MSNLICPFEWHKNKLNFETIHDPTCNLSTWTNYTNILAIHSIKKRKFSDTFHKGLYLDKRKYYIQRPDVSWNGLLFGVILVLDLACGFYTRCWISSSSSYLPQNVWSSDGFLWRPHHLLLRQLEKQLRLNLLSISRQVGSTPNL